MARRFRSRASITSRSPAPRGPSPPASTSRRTRTRGAVCSWPASSSRPRARREEAVGDNLGPGAPASAARAVRHRSSSCSSYPWLDLSSKRPSYSHFGTGFFLSEASLDWYRSHYLKDPAQVRDVRCSPLLAEHFEGLPPTYIATAGFDPLRDDGGEYAQRLRQAGVPVALHLHPGAIHGFANLIAVGHLARDPLLAAAGALRVGLAAAGTD